MKMTLDQVTSVVAGFVEKTHGTPAAEIQADTPLLQDGYLDSFDLIQLIAELEGSLGVSLPAGALIPEDFETCKTLHQRLADVA